MISNPVKSSKKKNLQKEIFNKRINFWEEINWFWGSISWGKIINENIQRNIFHKYTVIPARQYLQSQCNNSSRDIQEEHLEIVNSQVTIDLQEENKSAQEIPSLSRTKGWTTFNKWSLNKRKSILFPRNNQNFSNIT